MIFNFWSEEYIHHNFTKKEFESLERYSLEKGVPKSRIIKKLLQENNIIVSSD
ncbi:hypothetical protein N8772_02650 [Rickettsiales bacterium]|nr:hypothetical protein [Rickettsiales bacterium]MDB2550595.1 hypothetical protein [Rickettsiales bacterium]